jgi:hypothetical protein
MSHSSQTRRHEQFPRRLHDLEQRLVRYSESSRSRPRRKRFRSCMGTPRNSLALGHRMVVTPRAQTSQVDVRVRHTQPVRISADQLRSSAQLRWRDTD